MITCPYCEFLPCSDTILCMLYSKFKYDGKYWPHYPVCNKENCPLLHPELLGNMIWEKAPVV